MKIFDLNLLSNVHTLIRVESLMSQPLIRWLIFPLRMFGDNYSHAEPELSQIPILCLVLFVMQKMWKTQWLSAAAVGAGFLVPFFQERIIFFI